MDQGRLHHRALSRPEGRRGPVRAAAGDVRLGNVAQRRYGSGRRPQHAPAWLDLGRLRHDEQEDDRRVEAPVRLSEPELDAAALYLGLAERRRHPHAGRQADGRRPATRGRGVYLLARQAGQRQDLRAHRSDHRRQPDRV